MGELEFWGIIITTIGTLLGALVWPFLIVILVVIFRRDVASLIARIKSFEGAGVRLNWVHGDIIEHPSEVPSTKLIHQNIELMEPSVLKAFIGEAPPLSGEEGEKSRQRAQRRLEEDIARVGYQRGELRQLDDGSWAISWGGKYPL